MARVESSEDSVRAGAGAVANTVAEQQWGAEQQQGSARARRSWTCVWLSLLLIGCCCCGGLLVPVVGKEWANACNMGAPCFIMVYMLASGIFAKWWSGKGVGFWCSFLCWWCLFTLCFSCLLLCCFCTLLAGAKIIEPLALHAIKNDFVKKVRLEYDEQEKGFSLPRRAYYTSMVFKERCDALFDSVDTEHKGVLTMEQLRIVVTEFFREDFEDNPRLGEMLVPWLQDAFEGNGKSNIERAEFMEMMKFFSVINLKPPEQRPVRQHLETLSLPLDANFAEVKKQYRKLAAKYHPDKRPDDDQEQASKDMQDLNQAYESLQVHFGAKPERQYSTLAAPPPPEPHSSA